VHTVADEQLPQLDIWQGKQVLSLIKKPGLHIAHSLLAKQEAQLGTVQTSQLDPSRLLFKVNPFWQVPHIPSSEHVKQLGILHP